MAPPKRVIGKPIKKARSTAAANLDTGWTIIYEREGHITSDPEMPQFAPGQRVELTFINKSPGPVILGVVPVGRVHFFGPGQEPVPEIVDTHDLHHWTEETEMDSGIIPLLPNGGAKVKQFNVKAGLDIPHGKKAWEFVYAIFVVDADEDDNGTPVRRRIFRSILGQGVDPHVIITS